MFFFDHARREETRPASLRPENLRDVSAEIDRYFELPEEERRQTDVPQIWKRPFADDVLPALMKLSYGKCAFCERAGIPLQPYRFRPPAYATPRTRSNDKESYLWLAFDWHNLYPICEECLPEDKSFFPVFSEFRSSNPPSRINPLRSKLSGYESELDSPYLLTPSDVFISGRRVFTSNKAPYRPDDAKRLILTTDHYNLDRNNLVSMRRSALLNFANYISTGDISFIVSAQNSSRSKAASKISLINVLRRIDFYGYLSAVFNFAARQANLRSSNFEDLIIYSNHSLRFTIESKKRIEIRDIILNRFLKFHDTAISWISNNNQILERLKNWYFPLKDHDGTDFMSSEDGQIRSLSKLSYIDISAFKSIFEMTIQIPPSKRSAFVDADEITPDSHNASCLLMIGENATGKSSVLEAIALATMDANAFEEINNAGFVSVDCVYDPHMMGARDAEAPSAASITAGFDGIGTSTVSIEQRRPKPSRELEGPVIFPLVFAYGARRFFATSATVSSPVHVRSLFDPTAALPDPVEWLGSLSKRDQRGLDEVVSALRHIISIDGHFRNIEPQRGGDVWIWIERSSDADYFIPIPLKSASSGYRAILAVVCDIFVGLETAMRDASRGRVQNVNFHKLRMSEFLVLIDEIEAHLHPRWKMSIIGGLRRAFPRATFIMTSHDPLCLRGMNDGEVLALHRHRSGERDVVEAVAGFEGLQYRTVEQLLTSDLFRLMTTDPRSEREFDQVAELLKRRKHAASSLTKEEAETLRRFEEEIASSLPIGNTPVGAVVQEAVAEFLKERRHGDKEATGTARDRAKEAVKAFLKEVLG